MTLTIADVATTLQTVLTQDAQEAARVSGLIRRQRKLTGASFVQSLVFGWLAHPDATLEKLAQASVTVGTPVTPQAIDQRFTMAAAECFRILLQKAVDQALAAAPQTRSLLERFPGVYLMDSTRVSLPAVFAELWSGCGGSTDLAGAATLKVQLCWDILHGTITGLDLEAGRSSDATAPLNQRRLPAGSLRLADLGYFDLELLRTFSQQEMYWLTRLKWKTAVFVEGQRVKDLFRWLREHASASCDVEVEIGQQHRLPCRLVAVHVPEKVAKLRRKRMLRKARDNGEKVRPERLAACAWDLWVTNVPRALLTAAEVPVLGRVRWQVELLFKRWKSQGGLTKCRSEKPYRILCEVYAKLLGQVVQQWLLLLHWVDVPQRSLWQASELVKDHALALASVLKEWPRLVWLLGQLQGWLKYSGRLQKRCQKPATFQLLAIAMGSSDDLTKTKQKQPKVA